MSRKGISKISGNPSPKVGEKTIYTIAEWYPATPEEKRNPALVTWELFKRRSNGQFTTTNLKKKGDGSFTFGEVSQKHTYRLEAYLYKPEGKGAMTIDINPQPNEVPKIGKLDLHYSDNTKGNVFSFTEKLVAKAHCVNMRGMKLNFMLWEDDAKGKGHASGNLLIDSKQAYVERNGLATAEFMLTKALMKKAMEGEADIKQLEFYVTVEYYKDRKHASDNVEINTSIPANKPKYQPVSPKAQPKAKDSPATQKPPSKKEEKGILDKATDGWNELWDWQESKGTIKPDKKPTTQKPDGKSVSIIAETRNEKEKNKENLIIFPLLVKPENDSNKKWGKIRNWTAKQGANMTTFNSARDKGKRKHAGRDLYTNPLESVVAIADGLVLEVRPFYSETHQVTVRHTLKDGRDFIIRYGELDPKSITVEAGDKVTQKKELGKTGKLLKYIPKTKEYISLMKIESDTVFMIHFEHFTGSNGFDIKKNPLSNSTKPYMRRADLIDSLSILKEGYNNTFGNRAESNNNNVEEGFTEHHARKALLYIYNKYGREIAVIVEKMYRLETAHFTSKQYKACGTGGMEVFGMPPYYGWDPTTFKNYPEYAPIGTWSHKESPGLSGKGGNKQQTKKPKVFVKLPSVLAGMEYKAEYIVRHNGNYARWYNATDDDAQEKYKESLKGIKSKIVDHFKNEKE